MANDPNSTRDDPTSQQHARNHGEDKQIPGNDPPFPVCTGGGETEHVQDVRGHENGEPGTQGIRATKAHDMLARFTQRFFTVVSKTYL